eukprot:scaffold14343_cov99-Isochrysis_galbana.AAC.1
MADAASRAGHVQAAAGAAGLSSWRRRPLARPQAALSMLARQAEHHPLPVPAAQGMVRRRPMVMASSAQAGCQAPARAQSAGAILAATRVPPLRVVPGPADLDGRRGVTRAPAPLSGGVPAMAPPMAPLGRPASSAASGMMVVRRPLLAAATGEARSLPGAYGSAGPAGALVMRAPLPRLGGVPAMAPPTAPLGRPATAAVTGLMVVKAPQSYGGDGHGSPLGTGASTRERSGWAVRCDGLGTA